MSDCYCDYDPPEWCRSTVQRSRRERRCEECNCLIAAGEMYEYTAGKWEGYVSSFFTCLGCRDLRVWVQNNVPCACWEYGNLHESLKYSIEDACFRAPEETKGLWFGFIRRLAAIRRTKRLQVAA